MCNRVTDIAGWNAAAQMPKPEVRAIAPGSAFLFCRGGIANPEQEYARLAEALSAAEQEGVGERVEEGFGEIAFCLPFHSELAETS
jgi:hypothetical protein